MRFLGRARAGWAFSADSASTSRQKSSSLSQLPSRISCLDASRMAWNQGEWDRTSRSISYFVLVYPKMTATGWPLRVDDQPPRFHSLFK